MNESNEHLFNVSSIWMSGRKEHRNYPYICIWCWLCCLTEHNKNKSLYTYLQTIKRSRERENDQKQQQWNIEISWSIYRNKTVWNCMLSACVHVCVIRVFGVFSWVFNIGNFEARIKFHSHSEEKRKKFERSSRKVSTDYMLFAFINFNQ